MDEELITISKKKYEKLLRLVELVKTAKCKNQRGWKRRSHEIVRTLNEISDLPYANIRKDSVQGVTELIMADYHAWHDIWKIVDKEDLLKES